MKTINKIQRTAAGLVMERSDANPKEARTHALPEKVL